jgi:hypothetical protein
MRACVRVLGLFILVLGLSMLGAGCGGWHPLYADPAAPPPTTATYTATIDNGTVAPATNTVNLGVVVQFTATPTLGFEVNAYTINGGTPVTVTPATTSPQGGDPAVVNIAISQATTTIVFTTVATGASG